MACGSKEKFFIFLWTYLTPTGLLMEAATVRECLPFQLRWKILRDKFLIEGPQAGDVRTPA